MDCDRCGTAVNVTVQDACRCCGPIPLCGYCATYHSIEIAEEQNLDHDVPSTHKGVQDA